MRRCSVYVSPKQPGEQMWAADKCVQCSDQWYGHRNIGPGWRERSEAAKVQLGLPPYDNIILGDE